jgi:glucose/arabinose dehydrogenase
LSPGTPYRRLGLWLAALLSVCCVLPSLAAADPALPPGFQDEIAIAGIKQPTNFRFAPDGRVFVATKPGLIYVYESINDETPELFADLRTQVYDTGDRGLLGLAIDPEFENGRPYVYALYTYDHILGDPSPAPKWGSAGKTGDPCPNLNGGDACLVSGRLVRLTAEGPHAAPHAAPSAENPTQTQLLEGWCQQFSSHSIGDLNFGPEGALYVSGGDGASFTSADWGQLGTEPNPCGDAPNPAGTADAPPSSEGGSLRSQNMHVLNGKILRVNPDTGAPFAGNPLIGNGIPAAERTVAKGFRNPFRFALNPKTGEVYTDNVGSSEIEEIDRFQAPPTSVFNSGWPCYEGPAHQFLFKEKGFALCETLYAAEKAGHPETAEPFFYYSHGQSVVEGDECPFESGSALGGISFYEGSQLPSKYKGALFITDTVRGCVYVMFPGEDGNPDPETAERFLREGKIYPAVDIEEGPGGYLYYADLFGDENYGDGAIHKITYAPGAPTAKLTSTPPYGTTFPVEVEFDAGESSDPEGEALTYEWDLNGDGTFETLGGEKRTKVFTKTELEEHEKNNEPLNRIVAVRVKDPHGLTSVARLTVYPGDAPPTVELKKPTPSTEWSVGDTIQLEALGKYWKFESGTWKQKEDFAPLGYNWSTRLLHCPFPAEPTNCHAHPLGTFVGTRHESFFAPEHDYPSRMEVTVTYADARGLTATQTVTIYPRTAEISLASAPGGIELTAGTEQHSAPFTFTAIEKAHLVLSAPASAIVGGTTYDWQGWSDGGARDHTVTVEGDKTYTATYFQAGGEPPAGGGSSGGGSGGGSTGGSGGTGGGGGGGGGSTPPNTVLGKHPPKSTPSSVAKFTFSATAAGATFSCKLDGKPKAGCRSPKAYKKLKPGKHTFKVWATAGVLTDATPVKYTWKVLPPKR